MAGSATQSRYTALRRPSCRTGRASQLALERRRHAAWICWHTRSITEVPGRNLRTQTEAEVFTPARSDMEYASS